MRKRFLLLLALLGAMFIVCLWFYESERQQHLSDLKSDLGAVAHMRTQAVAEWRANCLRKGQKLMQRPLAVAQMAGIIQHPYEQEKKKLREAAEPLQSLEGYVDLYLLDSQFSPNWTLSTKAATVTQVDRSHVEHARDLRQPVLSDIQIDPLHNVPVLKTIVPLLQPLETTQTVVGYAVIVNDVLDSLFPLLTSWPLLGKTGETYLCERQGDVIRLLSPLRFSSDPLLSTTIPLSRADAPVVRAVVEASGFYRGPDYRGVPVYAEVSPITDSNWYLATELDQAEGATRWNNFARLFILLLMAWCALLVMLIWLLLQERAKEDYRRTAEAAARAGRLNHLYRMLLESNRLIGRARTEAEVLEGVARIAVDQGGFTLAWIGVAEPAGEVIPVAKAGEDFGYIDQVKASTDPLNPRSGGPMGICLRTGEAQVWNQFLRNQNASIWHEAANRLGISASAVLPIKRPGSACLGFCLYSGEEGFFGEGEVQTLLQMTEDIAHALENLELERKNETVQHEFRALSERLNDYMRLSPALNYVLVKIGDEWKQEWVSDNIERFCGYSKEEASAPDWWPRSVYPEDLENALYSLSRLTEGYSIQDEWRFLHKNGSILWLANSSMPIQNERGVFDRVVGVWTDITTRREAEERLLQTQVRYRDLFDANPVPMWICDFETSAFLAVNDAAINHYGYTRNELLGMSLSQIELHSDLPQMMPDTSGERRKEDFLCYMRQHRRKDGEAIDVEMRAHKILYEGREAVVFSATDITGRLKAERALAESEERLRLAVRAAGQGLWELNLTTQDTLIDEGLALMLGYAPEEFHPSYASFRRRTHPEDVRRLDESLKAHLEGRQEEFRIQVRHKTKNGLWKWIQAGGKVVDWDAQGRPSRMVGILTDIHALKESEERLRLQSASLEAAANAVVITDNTGRISWANSAFVSLTGFSIDEAWGRNPRELLKSGKHEADFYRNMWEVILRGEVWRGEIINRRKDGSYYYEEMTITPVFDEWKAITHFIAIKHDITEQKKAFEKLRQSEEALRHSTEQLRRVVDAGSIGLWDWDAEKNYCTYSDEWCRQIGHTPEELKNNIEDFAARLHPDDTARTEILSRKHVSAGQGKHSSEYRLLHKDGSYRWFLGNFSYHRDPTGSMLQISGAQIEVTQRKQLEEQFHQSQKMEGIGRLAGGVAHDFNNLLNVIGGYTEIALATVPDTNPLHDDLLQVKRAADRACALTRQLLAFSRRQILRPEVVNLNAILTDSEKMLLRLVGEDVRLSSRRDEKLWETLADPGQLEQVMLNLAVNARDAMPQGGEILVKTSNVILSEAQALTLNVKAGDYVCMAVRDTGSGMDAATSARIFEPFFTTKEQGKGTGLGLATVYGIIQQSGGGIEVRSSPGEGTEISVYLPRVMSVTVDDEAEADEEAPGGSETILLVEDEDALRILTQRFLESLGYRVLSAACGPDALEILQDHRGPVHCLLTDVIMPGMSGARLAEEVSLRHPGIPILYMSGYTDEAISHYGVLNKGVQLLSKPFSKLILARSIRQMLQVVA